MLDSANARYQVVEHEHAGKSEDVARVRGTVVGQGAKALVCEISGGAEQPRWVLAVLPADRKLDRKRLATALGVTKAKLADLAIASELTGCVIGAIPPFSFNEELVLIVDPDVDPDAGKRVVARIGDETTFKELVRDAGQWFLKPLNPQYNMIPVTEEVVICGVVRCAVQEE